MVVRLLKDTSCSWDSSAGPAAEYLQGQGPPEVIMGTETVECFGDGLDLA